MIEQRFGDYIVYTSQKSDADVRKDNLGFLMPSYQEHKDNILILSNPKDIEGFSGDGIITNLPSIKIGVALADCNGVLFIGKDYFGVIHAGRRGLKLGILNKALDTLLSLGEDLYDIQVFVGPSLRACCYDVGEDFLHNFDFKYFKKVGDRYFFDMIALIYDQLPLPKSNITISDICTRCSDDKYFSHRNGDIQRFLVGVSKLS